VAAAKSHAAPIITVPPDLNVGDQYRLAFITSTAHQALSPDIADYNTFVKNVANSAPQLVALGTTWNVIASAVNIAARDNTGTNPSSPGVPIYRLDGIRIANSNADLWDGQIAVPLQVTEVGGLMGPSQFVFTGTNPNGTRSSGVLGSLEVDSGLAGSSDSNWIILSVVPSAFATPFYGMSDVLTVVPEPSAVVLFLCFGALAALSRRHRA